MSTIILLLLEIRAGVLHGVDALTPPLVALFNQRLQQRILRLGQPIQPQA